MQIQGELRLKKERIILEKHKKHLKIKEKIAIFSM